MKVFVRGERRWQKNFAEAMGFFCSGKQEKNLVLSNRGFIENLKYYNKKFPFPPVEWLVDLTENVDCDIYLETGSRVLRTRKEYISYVENGLGVFSYNSKKLHFLNKKIFQHLVKTKYFKGFVFYSKASKASFEKITEQDCFSISEKIGPVIYPLVESCVRKDFKVRRKVGFCSSNFYLKGGRELLEVSRYFPEVKFDIITNISAIHNDDLISIPSNVNLLPFNMSSKQFIGYAKENWDIFIHPTFFDSFPLVILEMIKSGIPVISTDTFGISEMLLNNRTGILIRNPRNPFSSEFLPKEQGYLGDIIKSYSKRSDIQSSMVKDIIDSVSLLYSEYRSFHDATVNFSCEENCFHKEIIKNQWVDYLGGVI